jgi:hypothetical protein
VGYGGMREEAGYAGYVGYAEVRDEPRIQRSFLRADVANLGLATGARKAVTGIEMPVALLTTRRLTWAFLDRSAGIR